MKNRLLIALLIFSAIITILWISFKNVWDNIYFEVNYSKTSVNVRNWSQFTELIKGNGNVTVAFKILVANKTWLNIPIRNLDIKIYHKGELIGESSPLSLKNIDIASGKVKDWEEPINLFAKKQVVKDFLTELFNGRDPEITYDVKINVFGFSYTYSEKMKLIATYTTY